MQGRRGLLYTDDHVKASFIIKNALLEILLYVRMTPVTVVSGKEIFIS